VRAAHGVLGELGANERTSHRKTGEVKSEMVRGELT
jgi:hypothetical protein